MRSVLLIMIMISGVFLTNCGSDDPETTPADPIIGKWSVTNETLNGFDQNGNNIYGPITNTFLLDEQTFEFDGTREEGLFKFVSVEHAFWLNGNYSSSGPDGDISVDVNGSANYSFDKVTVESINVSDQSAEFTVTFEFTIENEFRREVRNLLLIKNGSSVPAANADDLIGEWSITDISEQRFEKDQTTGQFNLERTYSASNIPNDRISFSFNDQNEILYIDAYYNSLWRKGTIQYFDQTNYLFRGDPHGGQFLHLEARTADGEFRLKVITTELGDGGVLFKYIRNLTMVKNQGNAFSTTAGELVGEWLIKEAKEFKDGVDVTDPDNPDSGVGGVITLNADFTGSFSREGESEQITYNFIDGNTFSLEIEIDERPQELLFHILNLEVNQNKNEFRIIGGLLQKDERDCTENCVFVRFENEILLENLNP